MKVTVEEKKKSAKIKYPCLMESKGDIVLFISEDEGTLIKKETVLSTHVGEFIDSWIMSSFKPFTGTITLEND